MKFIVNLLFIITISATFSGCLLTHPGCITNGKLTAMECGRYATRYDNLKRDKTQLKKYNKNVSNSELGKKLTDEDANSVYNRFCKRFKGKELPFSKDLAADFKISLGDYSTHKFCKTIQDKKDLGLFEKETKQSTNYGYITWFISDGKIVYGYKHQAITYFKNSTKYGTATFSK